MENDLQMNKFGGEQQGGTTATGRRLAIIWCNEKYLKAPDLPGAKTDGRKVENYLGAIGFDEVRRRENLTYDAMIKDLRAMVHHVQANDLVTLYYTGHGSRRRVNERQPTSERGYQEFLVAVDNLVDGRSRGISGAILKGWIMQIRKKGAKVVVILDCCSSGGVTPRLSNGKDPGKFRIRRARSDHRPRSEQGLEWPWKGTVSESEVLLHPGFASSLEQHGVVVLAACKPDEQSWEIENDVTHISEGVFTDVLLELLAAPNTFPMNTFAGILEELEDRMQVRLRGLGVSMHPVLVGDTLDDILSQTNLGVLHSDYSCIGKVSKSRPGYVTLLAGSLSGATRKSTYELYTSPSADSRRVAVVQVEDVHVLESEARIIEAEPETLPSVMYFAKEVDHRLGDNEIRTVVHVGDIHVFTKLKEMTKSPSSEVKQQLSNKLPERFLRIIGSNDPTGSVPYNWNRVEVVIGAKDICVVDFASRERLTPRIPRNGTTDDSVIILLLRQLLTLAHFNFVRDLQSTSQGPKVELWRVKEEHRETFGPQSEWEIVDKSTSGHYIVTDDDILQFRANTFPGDRDKEFIVAKFHLGYAYDVGNFEEPWHSSSFSTQPFQEGLLAKKDGDMWDQDNSWMQHTCSYKFFFCEFPPSASALTRSNPFQMLEQPAMPGMEDSHFVSKNLRGYQNDQSQQSDLTELSNLSTSNLFEKLLQDDSNIPTRVPRKVGFATTAAWTCTTLKLQVKQQQNAQREKIPSVLCSPVVKPDDDEYAISRKLVVIDIRSMEQKNRIRTVVNRVLCKEFPCWGIASADQTTKHDITFTIVADEKNRSSNPNTAGVVALDLSNSDQALERKVLQNLRVAHARNFFLLSSVFHAIGHTHDPDLHLQADFLSAAMNADELVQECADDDFLRINALNSHAFVLMASGNPHEGSQVLTKFANQLAVFQRRGNPENVLVLRLKYSFLKYLEFAFNFKNIFSGHTEIVGSMHEGQDQGSLEALLSEYGKVMGEFRSIESMREGKYQGALEALVAEHGNVMKLFRSVIPNSMLSTSIKMIADEFISKGFVTEKRNFSCSSIFEQSASGASLFFRTFAASKYFSLMDESEKAKRALGEWNLAMNTALVTAAQSPDLVVWKAMQNVYQADSQFWPKNTHPLLLGASNITSILQNVPDYQEAGGYMLPPNVANCAQQAYEDAIALLEEFGEKHSRAVAWIQLRLASTMLCSRRRVESCRYAKSAARRFAKVGDCTGTFVANMLLFLGGVVSEPEESLIGQRACLEMSRSVGYSTRWISVGLLIRLLEDGTSGALAHGLLETHYFVDQLAESMSEYPGEVGLLRARLKLVEAEYFKTHLNDPLGALSCLIEAQDFAQHESITPAVRDNLVSKSAIDKLRSDIRLPGIRRPMGRGIPSSLQNSETTSHPTAWEQGRMSEAVQLVDDRVISITSLTSRIEEKCNNALLSASGEVPKASVRQLETDLERFRIAQHENRLCDGCGESIAPTPDSSWRCSVCLNFDLCRDCRAKGIHAEHSMYVYCEVYTCSFCESKLNQVDSLHWKCTLCDDVHMCDVCREEEKHEQHHPLRQIQVGSDAWRLLKLQMRSRINPPALLPDNLVPLPVLDSSFPSPIEHIKGCLQLKEQLVASSTNAILIGMQLNFLQLKLQEGVNSISLRLNVLQSSGYNKETLTELSTLRNTLGESWFITELKHVKLLEIVEIEFRALSSLCRFEEAEGVLAKYVAMHHSRYNGQERDIVQLRALRAYNAACWLEKNSDGNHPKLEYYMAVAMFCFEDGVLSQVPRLKQSPVTRRYMHTLAEEQQKLAQMEAGTSQAKSQRANVRQAMSKLLRALRTVPSIENNEATLDALEQNLPTESTQLVAISGRKYEAFVMAVHKNAEGVVSRRVQLMQSPGAQKETTLMREVHKLHVLCGNYKTGRLWRKVAQSVSKRLILPFHDFLLNSKAGGVFVCAHGWFDLVPFQVLSLLPGESDADFQPLGATHPITYVPLVQALGMSPIGTAASDSSPLLSSRHSKRLLAVIPTRAVDENGFAMDELEYAENEGRILKEAFQGETVLLGPEATLANSMDHLRGSHFQVVHVASHGIVPDADQGNPAFSRIGLEAPGGNMSAADLSVATADLISLSCCNTAKGKIVGVPMGIFLDALLPWCSKHVLATNWPVPDRETSELSVTILKLFLDRVPPEVALQQAVSTLLDADDKENAGQPKMMNPKPIGGWNTKSVKGTGGEASVLDPKHPQLWAGFQLYSTQFHAAS